jgi:eukaryotic-like serine/threonine-protein kinase
MMHRDIKLENIMLVRKV